MKVMGIIDITTLTNRQYCVILDPVGEDGKPQLGQKRLIKVRVWDPGFFIVELYGQPGGEASEWSRMWLYYDV